MPWMPCRAGILRQGRASHVAKRQCLNHLVPNDVKATRPPAIQTSCRAIALNVFSPRKTCTSGKKGFQKGIAANAHSFAPRVLRGRDTSDRQMAFPECMPPSRRIAMRAAIRHLFLVASQLCFSVAIAEQPPLPDPDWGGVGSGSTVYVGFNLISNAYDRGAYAALVLADGKLVMAGLAITDNTPTAIYDIGIVRLEASSGAPDTSFGGGDGRMNLGLASSSVQSAEVVLDPGDKLMVSAMQTNSSAVLVRLADNGSFDPSFDGDGKKFISAGNFLDGNSQLSGTPIVLPQANGKYLVIANAYRESPQLLLCIGMIRLNSNGSIDASFAAGTGRICEAPPYETLNAAQGLALIVNNQGDLLIAGAAYHSGSAVWDMSVLKLSAEGQRDSTFGEDGWAFVPFDEGGNLIDYANAISVDGQERIVIGGSASVGSNETSAAVARLTSSGQIDSSFAQNGKILLDLGPISAYSTFSVARIAIADSGRLLLGGRAEEGSFLAMLANDGAFDPGFGSDGRFLSTRGTSEDMIWSGDYVYSVGSGTNPASNRTEFAASRRIIPLFHAGFE